jgi:hypothetical protein
MDGESIVPCVWCGRTYEEHETFRAPNKPVPRCPCLLLKSGYAPKPPGPSVVDRLSVQSDGPSIPTDRVNLRLSRRLHEGIGGRRPKITAGTTLGRRSPV